MKFYNLYLFLLGASTSSTSAFVPQSRPNNVLAKSTSLSYVKNESPLESIDTTVRNTLSGLAVAAALWVAPATMAGNINSISPGSGIGNSMMASSMASAKEMASGSGSRVNKDPESLLRYGLPIKNKEVSLLHAMWFVPIKGISQNNAPY